MIENGNLLKTEYEDLLKELNLKKKYYLTKIENLDILINKIKELENEI